MSRFPSHGIRFGFPPKLQEQETAQLQLSATVAVMCQSGAGVCGAAESSATPDETATVSATVKAMVNRRTVEPPAKGYHHPQAWRDRRFQDNGKLTHLSIRVSARIGLFLLQATVWECSMRSSRRTA